MSTSAETRNARRAGRRPVRTGGASSSESNSGCGVAGAAGAAGAGAGSRVSAGRPAGSARTAARHHGHAVVLPTVSSGTWNGLPHSEHATGTNIGVARRRRGLVDDLVERVLDDAAGAGGFQSRDDVT